MCALVAPGTTAEIQAGERDHVQLGRSASSRKPRKQPKKLSRLLNLFVFVWKQQLICFLC